VVETPLLGRPGEIEVLSMFASVLRKTDIVFDRDDPYIEFDYKGRKWKVQHFHPRQRGVTVRGVEHNSDLVVWSNDNYVAYVEVKDRSADLHPGQAREFVGRILWKEVDDALFVSKKSTINRWQILDRYGIENTDHLLEAKVKNVEYREWPELVVENFIKNLGTAKTKVACQKVKASRKGKAIELLKRHKSFNGVGFKFVDTAGEKTVRHYISDDDRVIHAPYCIFITDSNSVTVFKREALVELPDLYEAYASSVDLGIDSVVFICPGFQPGKASDLFQQMGFQRMTEADIRSMFGVDIGNLPIFGWEKSTRYPLKELVKADLELMPPCVKNALDGVPDGLYETALFVQTIFKACALPFDGKTFSERCRRKIDEHWLGFEPSKTKKDTYSKVAYGAKVAYERNVDPTNLYCNMDTSGVKGPRTLDAVFHLQLCTQDDICPQLPQRDIYEYIRRKMKS